MIKKKETEILDECDEWDDFVDRLVEELEQSSITGNIQQEE